MVNSGVSVDVPVHFKMVSASVGALLTSLATTPLDVIKTRMQTTGAKLAKLEFLPSATSCIFYPICKEADASYLRTACVHIRKPSLSAAPSTLAVMTSVARHEGLKALWSGLFPALVMAVPATTLYYAAYDEMKLYLEHHTSTRGTKIAEYAPLFAGIAGRTLTTTVVAPLELMRTKLMYRSSGQSLARDLLQQVRGEGWTSLWKGLSPTLWRDVPFSGVYWLLYERTRDTIAQRYNPAENSAPTFTRTFELSFASGVIAGAVAAFLTTPFDVIKTRRQVQSHREAQCKARVPHGTFQLLKFIAREEGSRGLFAGLTARVAKVAPACAIMISSYELGKQFFARHPIR